MFRQEQPMLGLRYHLQLRPTPTLEFTNTPLLVTFGPTSKIPILPFFGLATLTFASLTMLVFGSPILAVVLYLLTIVSSVRLDNRAVNGQILDCYDYIIVGGGVSGLVVANRLTEDSNGKSQRIQLKYEY